MDQSRVMFARQHYNLEIVTKSETLKTHQFGLCALSPWWRKRVATDLSTRKNGILSIEVPYSSTVMSVVIDYCNQQKIEFTKRLHAMNVLAAAYEFEMPGLVYKAAVFLAPKTIIEAVDVLGIAAEYNIQKLKMQARAIVYEDPTLFWKYPFNDLTPAALKEILIWNNKRSLGANEGKVVFMVLNWAKRFAGTNKMKEIRRVLDQYGFMNYLNFEKLGDKHLSMFLYGPQKGLFTHEDEIYDYLSEPMNSCSKDKFFTKTAYEMLPCKRGDKLYMLFRISGDVQKVGNIEIFSQIPQDDNDQGCYEESIEIKMFVNQVYVSNFKLNKVVPFNSLLNFEFDWENHRTKCRHILISYEVTIGTDGMYRLYNISEGSFQEPIMPINRSMVSAIYYTSGD